jgi:hypothetical protein
MVLGVIAALHLVNVDLLVWKPQILCVQKLETTGIAHGKTGHIWILEICSH